MYNEQQQKHRINTLLLLICCSISQATSAGSDIISDALGSNYTTSFSIRARYEHANDSTPPKLDNTSHATTLKTSLGFVSNNEKDYQFGIEFNDVRALDNNNYNNGTNNLGAPEITDPEDLRVQQVYVSTKSIKDTVITFGRQLIELDNQRFFGSEPFRQNGRSFDAITISNTVLENTRFYAAYISNINTTKGTKNNIESNSGLLNVRYDAEPIASISSYYYLIDHDDPLQANDSSETIGVRFAGSTGKKILFFYSAELASQRNIGINQLDYKARYEAVELGLKIDSINAKFGYEKLGTDHQIAAFQTPLGNRHEYQGHIDNFLQTPAEGLIDHYYAVNFFVARWKMNFFIRQHLYKVDLTENALGSETNLEITRSIGGVYFFGIKYGKYNANNEQFEFRDAEKIWLTLSAEF